SYDSLSLYYVGMGGNTNTTTRFRKYVGDGTKPLLYEHDRKLEANHTYHVRTEVVDGVTTFTVDGQELFRHNDPDPLTSGYFGLRSTYSCQAIDNVRIYRLINYTKIFFCTLVSKLCRPVSTCIGLVKYDASVWDL